MATYAEIQKDIKLHEGLTVKTCWIAHVKEINGLPMRQAPNRANSTVRQYPCPQDIRPMIEASMKRLGML